ncbi:nucleotidyl transferase AbiEii/AbiGii toxin family protein [Rothia endophytica]|uniref:nucleotidyl transferase AbiEii/AbiGii toxin family protein n=1 Tax=Rothia endophytica TaxID=1324766 RepID=UPI002351A04F|nr:nucleotidyl transferase AbiEii/AbiGii toxin family protein [Rothia endophytica]
MSQNRPTNLRSLQNQIRNIAGELEEPEARLQRTMGLVVVCQMLPEGAIKGGSAMALRYGRKTRFTKDLDAERQGSLDAFRDDFEEMLEHGWQGFTGRLIEGRQREHEGVPTVYLMQPFQVKLSYGVGRGRRLILSGGITKLRM